MATPKKKHLIELMIEAGVKWPDGAEYAAQDKKDRKVYFFPSKPTFEVGYDYYSCDDSFLTRYVVLLPSLCRNWHQTIVTREQYAEAVAAVTPCGQHEEREIEDIPAVDSVEWHNPPTIEQLTADYHAKAAEADRLQSVADDALKAADDALLALEKAGELIGLVISIDTKPKQAEQQVEPEQPEITDWRDLRVGDVVWIGDLEGNRDFKGECTILELDIDDDECPLRVIDCNGNDTLWPSIIARKWRFIRRP